MVPSFTGQPYTLRTSLSTEDVYVWGRYPVVVEAAGEGNTALCLFNIYVQNDQCTTPPTPPNAKSLLCLPLTINGYETAEYKQCGITCEDGHAPSIPGPHLFTCGPSGNWDPVNQFVPYRLSPCGSATTAKRSLIITIRYRLLSTMARECASIVNALTKSLKETQVELNNKWTKVCSQPDCSDTIIEIICPSNSRRRKRDTTFQVDAILTLPDVSDTVTSTTGETVPTQSLYDGLLLSATDNPFDYSDNIVDTFPFDHDISIEAGCVPPQVLNDQNQCVECGPGTFYRNATAKCEFCVEGTYQELEGQFTCTPCTDGSTTENYGSHNQTDCRAKCPAGQYFDMVTKCTNCSRGFYQPESGQFFCKACPADKTTKFPGTVSESSCANDCPPGQEIGPNNECTNCTIGFYRGTNDPLCIRCPAGNVTMSIASKSIDDCNVADNPPGTYRNSSDPKGYTLCPVDEYQPLRWQDSCLPCNQSYKAEAEGATSASQCKFYCPAGQEKIAGEDTCKPCSLGFYRDGTKVFDRCDQCPSEYTTESTGAKSESQCSLYRCPAGSKANATQTGCELCPLGQYQSLEDQTDCIQCTGENNSTRQEGAKHPSSCESFCLSGYEKINGNCQECDVGFFKDNAEDVFGSCKPCADNRFITADRGATSNDNCTVLNCTEGFKANMTSVTCEACPKGSYQDKKYQTSCIPCGSNEFTRDTASTSKADCESYCEPGKEKLGDNCESCARGFYKNNDADVFMSCTACDAGFVTPDVGFTHKSNCTVPDCKPGSYINGDACIKCPHGEYQNESLQYSCIACPTNKNTTSTGADSIELCLLHCPAGTENPTGTDICEPCAVAYYKDVAGTTTCLPCAADLTQNDIMISFTEGADNIAKCDKLVCKAGYSPETGACAACPYGRYQPDKWQDVCLNCTQGKTTYVQGATSDTECKPECNLGEELYNDQCRQCEVGFYNDKSDPERQTCFECEAGKITSGPGATSQSACSIKECTDPGTYRDDVTNSCKPCPIGQFQNETRQDSCQLCPSGETTKYEGSSSINDCKKNCSAGQQLNETSGQCEQCPKGFYRSKGAGEDSWTCEACTGQMTTSGTGATQSSDCNIPTCSLGHAYNRTDNRCVACPVNTYQDRSGQFLPCKVCPDNQVTSSTSTVSLSNCYSACQTTTPCSITAERCVDDTSFTRGYRCDCLNAYTKINGKCVHKCNQANYCGNKGMCQRAPFQCICSDGYTGDRCTIRPAASSQSDDEVETIVTAVVASACGLLFIILIAVCCCVMARRQRRRTPSDKTYTGSDYDDPFSVAPTSMKGYEDYPQFSAVNPAFSSRPPSIFMGQGMSGQGLKMYNNPTFSDIDNDPAVYKA